MSLSLFHHSVPFCSFAFVGLSFDRVVLERVWRTLWAGASFSSKQLATTKVHRWKQARGFAVTQKLHQPLVPRRPPASRVKTRQEVGGVERVPPRANRPTSLPTADRRSSSFQRRRKPAADEEAPPSTSQFLTGGRREQTLRMSLVSRSSMTRTVTSL